MSQSVRIKVTEILTSAGIKRKISSIIKRILISSLIFSIIIFFLFFVDVLRKYSGSKFPIALFTFWFVSFLIAFAIIIFITRTIKRLRC